MAASIHLIEQAGPARDHLCSLLEAQSVEVSVASPNDSPVLPQCDAAVFLADEDPFAPGGLPEHGVVAGWAEAAAMADARFIFCSSVLLYADGGETELMANDPELGWAPELRKLQEAELDVFGSRAEVVLLRLGIVIGPGGTHARSLSDAVRAGRLGVPVEGERFVPVLDRETLASALSALAPSDLHGGWDLVAGDAPLAELLAFASGVLSVPGPAVVPLSEAMAAAGPEDASRWLVSRRVTGHDLRETGAVGARDWKSIVEEALR